MPASAGDLVQLARLAGLGVLFGLRRLLGVALRLDGGSQSDLPVPGCAERSLVARLTAEDRARNRLDPTAGPVAGFRAVYVFEDEALHEVSNRTIHALLHLSWCDGEPSGVVLAVYVKSRGLLSDAYLALIGPFRHLIVYPAWIRHLQRVWEVCR